MEKIRILNELLQKNPGTVLNFGDLAKVVGHCIESNTYIISNEGLLLGHSMEDSQVCDTMTDIVEKGGVFPKDYNADILSKTQTEVNIERHGVCTFYRDSKCHLGNKFSTIVPIIGGGQRWGTLVLSKLSSFSDGDVVLAEYCATLVGMEIIRSKTAEIAKNAREKEAVAIATKALSYSEIEALLYLFKDFQRGEGIVNASKLAKEADITRSVIVNALRKLESAGVIDACSLGVKGNHIKIINDHLTGELNEVRRRHSE
ncbi:MAG: GTP-sensing pleiotropic transcriptional regulator CodY [Bacillota bacterium]|nr:GTP-sensing pleiotropic transcriptional regulator CodY [Bacillota bacterium]